MRNKENKVKCKMGIGKELFIFLLAVLAGAIVRLAYRCISCLREVVHHAHWVIELEDLIYWIGTAIFFVCADLLHKQWYCAVVFHTRCWNRRDHYVSFSCDYGENLSENCTAA